LRTYPLGETARRNSGEYVLVARDRSHLLITAALTELLLVQDDALDASGGSEGRSGDLGTTDDQQHHVRTCARTTEAVG
jgi:hypothetical protein